MVESQKRKWVSQNHPQSSIVMEPVPMGKKNAHGNRHADQGTTVGSKEQQTMAAQNNSKGKFDALLTAFRESNPEVIERLAGSLDEVRQYAHTLTKEQDDELRRDLGDSYEALIIFLATHQPHEPLDWYSPEARVPVAIQE
jgi:ABC-type nitrate/sulfonate/bicarbonate transport system substrate-binding protein